MAGHARKGVNMESRLRQPSGVALDGFGIVMTLGALDVYVAAGHGKERLYGMRIMAINASRICGVRAFAVLIKNGGMAILALCPGGPNSVFRMIFGYLVMAGGASDPRVRRQAILHRVDIKMPASIHDGLFTVAGNTIIFCSIQDLRYHY